MNPKTRRTFNSILLILKSPVIAIFTTLMIFTFHQVQHFLTILPVIYVVSMHTEVFKN